MNIEALRKVFPEGSEVRVNLPVVLRISSYEVEHNGEPYLTIEAQADTGQLEAIGVVDEEFTSDIYVRLDNGITPVAFMALIGKESTKVKAKLKKEIQAQIKKLQEELDSL